MATRRPRMAQPVMAQRKREAPKGEPQKPDAEDQAAAEPQPPPPETGAVEMLPSLDSSQSRQPGPSDSREPSEAESPHPQTVREIVSRVEEGWRQFSAAASAFPSERMDERLSDGWTRKQMLAHISAWHDLTHDRLGKMILAGKPEERVEDTDAFNARVARQAIGRTAGEILKEMEMTFNRLRRQLGRLSDEQLVADDGWAAHVIASNTYEHYAEHWDDVYQPPPPDGRGSRR